MDKLILVLYVDVQGVPEEGINDYIKMVSKSLFPEDVLEKLNATTFIIPRIGGGTIIEAINPKFIVDVEVYKDFRLKIDVLNENISDYLKFKTTSNES